RAGINTIEWTFDPLALRNAYFNIVRLGAIVRRYIPDCYGVSSSPLHGSLPTDRFVAEWQLGSGRVEGALRGTGREAGLTGADEVEIRVEGRAVQAELRTKFTELFSRGYAVTGFRREQDECAYVLELYED